MKNRSQTLSEGQKDDVIRIFHDKILKWILICFAILAGITGMSIWGIIKRAEIKVEELVANQFKESRIQEVVRQVAAERASVLITEQITPEVTKFKADVANQLKTLHSLVAKTQKLEATSRKHEQSIQEVLGALRQSLRQSQNAHNQLSMVKSDIVEMQKYIATIQYYQIEGANRLPNPYRAEMADALNKLVAIVIPNVAERNKFITELRGKQKK